MLISNSVAMGAKTTGAKVLGGGCIGDEVVVNEGLGGEMPIHIN